MCTDGRRSRGSTRLLVQQTLRAEATTSRQPTDLPKEAFPAILKRTFKQFSEDQLTTWAAALTYFGVLSLFPMLLALVSVLGVIGPSATQPLLDHLGASRPARPRTSSRTS